MPKVLHLKKGARVMLLINLSKDLVNGSLGVVKGFSQQRFPIVQFDGESSLIIEPKTLTISDRNDSSNIVPRRTQLPLKLAWAITAHKSQGMTLPCVEVHCGNEFTSGQLYVSLSRAQESKGLSLVGFSNARFIPPPNTVVDFYAKLETDLNIDLTDLCCNNVRILHEVFENCGAIENVYFENGEPSDDEITEEDLAAFDNVVAEYFEAPSSNDSEDTCFLDLDDILDDLNSEDEVAKPGIDFDYKLFLKSLKLPRNSKRPPG